LKPLTIVKRIIRNYKKYNSSYDESAFYDAFYFVKKLYKRRKSIDGEAYIIHHLRSAYRLSELKVDDKTLIASILFDCSSEEQEFVNTRPVILEKFGQEIAELLDGAWKLTKVKYLMDMEEKQIHTLRKLVLSLTNDIRVILIEMSHRWHRLKMYDTLGPSEEKTRLARETLEISVPIADGLGIWELKWRLEDLSFKFLKPEAYHYISSNITESKTKMDSYIRKVTNMMKSELKQHGVENYVITGRVKNLYSIYKKVVIKNRSLDEIYDIIAIRIIVDRVEDCYQVLGIIHGLWRPLTYRIKDYIAVPKMNGYRSLHTTIFCIDNHLTEVQIRTHEMHEEAEYGHAAHLAYRTKKMASFPSKEQTKWIMNLKYIKLEVDKDDNIKQRMNADVFSDHIFVFTPKGHVKDMVEGSTPIDFAYAIHTNLGNTCVGAKVNGKMIQLDTKLKNGDVIEILSKKSSSGPKMAWLSMVKTSRAKNKIRSFLKSENRDENMKIGRELLLKELVAISLKLSNEDKKKILEKLPYNYIEDVYVAIGEGSLSPSLVVKKIDTRPRNIAGINKRHVKVNYIDKSSILIEGEKNFDTKIAKCCNPKNNDEIVAYITVRTGISIHKKSCGFIQKANKDRLINAWWK